MERRAGWFLPPGGWTQKIVIQNSILFSNLSYLMAYKLFMVHCLAPYKFKLLYFSHMIEWYWTILLMNFDQTISRRTSKTHDFVRSSYHKMIITQKFWIHWNLLYKNLKVETLDSEMFQIINGRISSNIRTSKAVLKSTIYQFSKVITWLTI